MMEAVKKWFSDYKAKNREYKKKMLAEKSNEMYQVKEFEGKLWLTFNGQYVCPCEMLNGEPIELLNNMRKLFVEKITKL